jgi:heme exporter protein D
VAWFGCYSIAHFWDISWGTRPSSEAQENNQAPLLQLTFEEQQDRREREARLKQTKDQMMNAAQTYAAMVLLANLVFLLLYVQDNNSQYYLLVVSILIWSFSAVQMFLSLLYFTLHYLLEESVFVRVKRVLDRILERYPPAPQHKCDCTEENHPLIPKLGVAFPWSTLWSSVALSCIQLAIKFGYQSILQTTPTVLKDFEVPPNLYVFLSWAYPPLSFVAMFTGYLGDRLEHQEGTRGRSIVVFKWICGFGVVLYVLATILGWAVTYDGSSYWVLMGQSCLQVFALNVVDSSAFVVFLRYAPSDSLLSFVVVRAILGTVGNLIPSIIDSCKVYSDPFQLLTVLSGVGCLLLMLSFCSLLAASKGEQGTPPSSSRKAYPTSSDRAHDLVLLDRWLRPHSILARELL